MTTITTEHGNNIIEFNQDNRFIFIKTNGELVGVTTLISARFVKVL